MNALKQKFTALTEREQRLVLLSGLVIYWVFFTGGYGHRLIRVSVSKVSYWKVIRNWLAGLKSRAKRPRSYAVLSRRPDGLPVRCHSWLPAQVVTTHYLYHACNHKVMKFRYG